MKCGHSHHVLQANHTPVFTKCQGFCLLNTYIYVIFVLMYGVYTKYLVYIIQTLTFMGTVLEFSCKPYYNEFKDVITMARQARIKEAFGIYYVTQKSSGCRPLFKNDEDRNLFIDILQKTVNKFNCRIIEYCVQDNDTYHLILDVNGGDLSKIMKSINIPFAMHATCEGKLFNDRYKSSPVANDIELMQIRNGIQASMNPDGGFSSFCGTPILPCEDVVNIVCNDCIATTDAAYARLQSAAQLKDQTINELLKDKATRNTLIKEIRQTSTLSLKSIGQVFGGLSESSICKILNQ